MSEERNNNKNSCNNTNDEKSQNNLSNLYIETKYEKVFIIDFIKTENRDSMINGLKKLYKYDEISEGKKASLHFENIPNFKYPGKLVGSHEINIGYIANSRHHKNHHSAVTRELPIFLEYMRISFSTYDDKYFCITIECNFHEEYKDPQLRETFIHIDDWIEYEKNNLKGRKRKGPEMEPSFNEKIREITEFLSDYIEGIYITKKNYFKKQESFIPNIKILSVGNIDFSNFKEWSKQHFQYFRFFDICIPTCSKKDDFLISIQENTRSFGKMTTTAGLILLYKPSKSNTGNINSNINQIIREILPYFYIYYRTNFIVESKLPKFNEDKKQIKNGIISRNINSPKDIYNQIFDSTISTYFEYSQFYFNEKECLRGLHKIIDQKLYDFKVIPLWSENKSISDLVKDDAIALLEIEERDLENTKQEFESLKDFNEDITTYHSTRENLRLQSKISKLTVIMVILTIIIAVLTIVLVFK